MRMIIDPRCGRKTRHDHAEILTCVVIGYLVGRLSLRRSLSWCQRHLTWLRQYMDLKNGIASVSTVSRLLGTIDEEEFVWAFIEWMTEILNSRGHHIAIDGKALRGGTERIKDGKTPYILNAIEVATGLVIAQLPILEKESEKMAIPKLLSLLNLKNSTITIDAIGTTQQIIEEIRMAGGHFLLTVKKGNPLTYEELKDLFHNLEKEQKKTVENPGYRSVYEKALESYDEYKKSEKNRERMEYREMRVSQDTSMVTMSQTFPCLQTLGWLEQIRIPIEKDSEGNDITPDKNTYLQKGSKRNPGNKTCTLEDRE